MTASSSSSSSSSEASSSSSSSSSAGITGNAVYQDQTAGTITGYKQSLAGIGSLSSATVTMTTSGTVPANEPASTGKTVFYLAVPGVDSNSNYFEVGVDTTDYGTSSTIAYYVTYNGVVYTYSATVSSITAGQTYTMTAQ
jgi:hypothetical protein